MTEPIAALTNAFFARWALAGSGVAVDMQARIAPDKPLARGYGDSFFSGEPATFVGVLVGFLILFFALAASLVTRNRRST